MRTSLKRLDSPDVGGAAVFTEQVGSGGAERVSGERGPPFPVS